MGGPDYQTIQLVRPNWRENSWNLIKTWKDCILHLWEIAIKEWIEIYTTQE